MPVLGIVSILLTGGHVGDGATVVFGEAHFSSLLQVATLMLAFIHPQGRGTTYGLPRQVRGGFMAARWRVVCPTFDVARSRSVIG